MTSFSVRPAIWGLPIPGDRSADKLDHNQQGKAEFFRLIPGCRVGGSSFSLYLVYVLAG